MVMLTAEFSAGPDLARRSSMPSVGGKCEAVAP
jgi:hypothetical protein